MQFEEFARARLPALLRYATLLCGDREEARDLVQDVLAKALVKWRRIGAADEAHGYPRPVGPSQFLSARRRRRLWPVPLRPEHEPAVPAGGDDRDDRLWHLLGTLPR